MGMRVNRGVLYSGEKRKKSLLMKKEAPHVEKTIQNREHPCLLCASASLTVEAAFCGTLFFLALFSLLYLFQMLTVCQHNQNGLAGAAAQYACYGRKAATLSSWMKEKNHVMWNEQEKICYLKGVREIPFLGAKLFHVSWYQQIKISSYEGKSMVTEGKQEETYVYLAEHGRVYHRNQGCVYLNPGIQSIHLYGISYKRNSSGGKYYPCESCVGDRQISEQAVVYYTPYGDRWHAGKNCSRIKRNVRKVKISEVGGLPACSKCGGG